MREFITADEALQEIKDNRGAMQEFFASKGWDLWLKWSKAMQEGYFDASVRLPDAKEREEARLTGLALERFSQLPIFLMGQAETVSAEQAPTIP